MVALESGVSQIDGFRRFMRCRSTRTWRDVITKLTRKWVDRYSGKRTRRRRERDVRRLADHALRCLRLSDPQPLAPRTMRDWLG